MLPGKNGNGTPSLANQELVTAIGRLIVTEQFTEAHGPRALLTPPPKTHIFTPGGLDLIGKAADMKSDSRQNRKSPQHRQFRKKP